MFRQIENVSNKWINEQLEILTDTQILIANLNQPLGKSMQEFISKFNLLDKEISNAICKDHTFHNWLFKIKTEVINAYENKEHILDSEKLNEVLSLLHLSIAVITKSEFQFSISQFKSTKILFPTTGLYCELPSHISNSTAIHCTFKPLKQEIIIGSNVVKLSSFRQVASIKIVNNNFDFFSDPTGDKYAIDYDNEIDLEKWVITLIEALEIIKSDATSEKLVKHFASYLVPLKQKEIIKNLSFSVRNLPRVIFKNNELNPYLIGETLVHEADHQFFYAIEKFQKFWNTDVQLQDPIYLSPWRDDPRPLDGILRGLSSFARVSKYYSTILSTSPLSLEQIESVGTMLLVRLNESKLALDTIIQTGELSAFGIQYADEINETLQEVESYTKKYEHFERWNENALKAIEAHKRNWNILNLQNE